MPCCRSSTCAASPPATSPQRSPLCSGPKLPTCRRGVIARLTAAWEKECERWQRRDLSAWRYVYIWADGVYLQARMEPQAECILVIIGATPEGRKELLGFHVGTREGAQSWRELLVDRKARGLAIAPELAVGDGALGFWKALDEIFPGARHQRCWVHKVANVLGNFPKSMAPAVKSDLRDVWQAETRAAAQAAMDTFAEKYGVKYDKAVACLTRDREALLAFFDFPPSTGIICARQTRSRASSPRSATGPSGQRARSRRKRRS
jgi:putative transposase